MKILILEDDKYRVEAFKEKLKACSVTVTGSVQECIRLLRENDWEMLFLDHDLNGHVFVPSDGDEETGWHVARFLSENPAFQPPIIIVHSLNGDGVDKMLEKLPNAQRIPYVWDRIRDD